jgi:hypothetical protein
MRDAIHRVGTRQTQFRSQKKHRLLFTLSCPAMSWNLTPVDCCGTTSARIISTSLGSTPRIPAHSAFSRPPSLFSSPTSKVETKILVFAFSQKSFSHLREIFLRKYAKINKC